MVETQQEPERPVAERVRTLRKVLGLTQEQLASLGGLRRTDVVLVEGGYNKATSSRIRSGLARGFGLPFEDADAYLSGAIDLESAIEKATRRQVA